MQSSPYKSYFKDIFKSDPLQDHLLDALRALSVLSIIIFHVNLGVFQAYGAERAKNYMLEMPWFQQPLWHFEKGVDIFFFISAFVLGVPLFKNLHNFNLKASLQFYKKRIYRIYPLFFIALVLYTVAQWSYCKEYFLTNMFLINNLIEGQRTIIPVGWSLLVEVQYYALLPLLFIVLRYFKYRFSLLVGLIGLSFLANYIILESNSPLYTRPLTDIFLAEDRHQFARLMGQKFYEANMGRFGPFAIGLLVAYLRVFYKEKTIQFFKNPLVSLVALILSFGLIVFSLGLPMYNPKSWYYQDFNQQLHFWSLLVNRQALAIAIGLVCFGMWADSKIFALLSGVFKLKIWNVLSKLAFPIYLFHFPFIALSAVILFGTTNVKLLPDINMGHIFLISLLTSVLTVLFSIPLYMFVERPFIEKVKTKAQTKALL